MYCCLLLEIFRVSVLSTSKTSPCVLEIETLADGTTDGDDDDDDGTTDDDDDGFDGQLFFGDDDVIGRLLSGGISLFFLITNLSIALNI